MPRILFEQLLLVALLTSSIIDQFTGGHNVYMICMVFIAGYLIWIRKELTHSGTEKILLFFVILKLLSEIANFEANHFDTVFAAIVFAFYVLTIFQLVSRLNGEHLERLAYVCNVLVIVSLAISAYGNGYDFKIDFLKERPWPYSVHPVWWSEILLVSFYLALFHISDGRHRLIFAVLNIYFMLYIQSRGVILAAIFLSASYLYLNNKYLFGLFVVALYSIRDFLLYDIFLIRDAERGISSGASGRMHLATESYQRYSFNLRSFLVGDGMHKYDNLHNGYIKMVFEQGWLFFLFFILCIAYTLFKKSNNTPAKIYIAAYLLFIMFSPRNIGFSLGAIFFVTMIIFVNKDENTSSM